MSALTPPPSLFGASGPERRALQFFYQRTSSQLSGFYSCEFWNTIVLQIASWDDGIRHGLVALASLHEEYEREGAASVPSATNRFALVQYNLAIRQHLEGVRDRGLSENVEVFVAPCLIFICIEVGYFPSNLRASEHVLDANAYSIPTDASGPFWIGSVPREKGARYLR